MRWGSEFISRCHRRRIPVCDIHAAQSLCTDLETGKRDRYIVEARCSLTVPNSSAKKYGAGTAAEIVVLMTEPMKPNPIRYDTGAAEMRPGTSYALMLELIGSANRVLDIGCATGGFSVELQRRGHTVVGVEIDPTAGKIAADRGVDVRIADVTEQPIAELLAGEQFDCVVFADVLERLVEPEIALRDAQAVLAPGGYIVVSVPNVAHASVKLGLMLDRFDYQSLGLLDRTHVHFFSREELFSVALLGGFVVTDMHRSLAGPFEVPESQQIPLREIEVDDTMLEAALIGSESLTYQFVARLDRIDGEGWLTHDVPSADAIHDMRIALVAQSEELRRYHMFARCPAELESGLRTRGLRAERLYGDALLLRDELIGARAEIGNLRFQLDELDQWHHREVRILNEQVNGLLGSRAWRVGRLMLAPARGFRAIFRIPRR